MSKTIKKVSLLVIAVIVVLFVVIFLVNRGNTDINALVTDYINALSEKNNDKLYELSMVKELDGDITFLSKDVFANCLEPIYEDFVELFMSDKDRYSEYFFGKSSSETEKIIEEPFGDFKIQNIEFSDGKQSASVEVYFLKYDKSKNIYVKKFKNKWAIEELTDIDVYNNYEIKVPKGIKINKFAGVNVDEKYIDSHDNKTSTYKFPKIYETENPVEYEFWGEIKCNDDIGFEDGSIVNEPYISLNNIDKEYVYKIKTKVVKDLTTLVEGVFDNKDFKSISKDFSKDDNLSSLEGIYNDEKKWYYDNNKHKYLINYDSENDFIDYVYIDEDTKNIVVVFLMDFQSTDGNSSYQCRYAFVYNPETGKLIDLKEDGKKIMPTANRTLFNHGWMK